MAVAEKKAYFATTLDVRLVKGDRIWELEAALRFWSAELKCYVQAPMGYQTDFASVPRVPVAYWLYGGRAHHEGTLHDWAFCKDAINPRTGKPFTFMEANDLFLEAMTARKKPFYVRYPMYAAVCAFSYPFYHKRKVFDKL